jgi:hypothetical protein
MLRNALIPRMSKDPDLFVFHRESGIALYESESSCTISVTDGATNV